MARSVKIAKGLVLKQQENQLNPPIPDKSITLNQLSDEVKYIRIESVKSITIPSGFTHWVPVLKVKNGHKYTIQNNAILMVGEYIVEPGGEIEVLSGGELRVIG
jgi:hypothetical protein